MRQHARTGFDAAAQFSRYRTYAWGATPEVGAPLIQQRITASLDAKLSIDTLYSGGGLGGWGPPGNSSARVRSYTVGTLVVDMFDAKSKRAVWRGTASGALPKSADQASAKTQEAIDRMFASFPGASAKR